MNAQRNRRSESRPVAPVTSSDVDCRPRRSVLPLGRVLKRTISVFIGALLIGAVTAADVAPLEARSDARAGQIRVVPASDRLLRKAAEREDTLGRLLKAAQPTIGVPYKWGGTRMDKGVDCSNYTWQLYRSLGTEYDGFLSTMAMSRLQRANDLRKISFEEALPGDLLVYGHRDRVGRWRGHVVILVDKEGDITGHKGLVLGAHGASIGEVQYVTYTGFDKGYFKDPQMRLANVLRVAGTHQKTDLD